VWQKVLIVAVIAAVGLLVVGAVASIPASAQQDNGNETTTPDDTGGVVNNDAPDPEEIEFELEDVDIRSVEFDNGTVVIDAYYHERASLAVTDSGTVKGLGDNERARVPFEVYTRGEGEYRLTMELGTDDELVTLQQGGEMRAASGDRTTLNVIQGASTVPLIQWGTIAGGIGASISLSLTVGILRRRHQNTYKELLSGERVKVDQDPVQGLVGRVTRFVSEHRYVLILAATGTLYGTLTITGYVPGPVELWDSATDAQRVIVVGSAIMTILTTPVIYPLAIRLWNPAKEYVIDVDARDVLDPSLGSNGGLAIDADDPEEVADELDERDDMDAVAVYSGAPERVSKMRVDGQPADARTPGGDGHVVQEFEPQRNAAVGCWPGTASDVELLGERSKIDGNREVLRDESRMLRTLIGAMPAIATASDTDSMRAVDSEIRNLVNVDSDPIDSLLNRAASGTRFEGMYSENDEEDDEDDEEEDDDIGLGDLVDPRDDDDEDDEEDN